MGTIQKLLVVLLVVISTVIIAVLAAHLDADQRVAVDWPPPRLSIEDCLANYDARFLSSGEPKPTAKLKVRSCRLQLFSQGHLDDFQIRRSKFYQQNYADTIILWMVVFITISGIALAALQLSASYLLAARSGVALGDLGGELTIESGKISLRSSLAGILILTISFGFFWLFVNEVYVIHEIDVDQRSDTHTETADGRYGFGLYRAEESPPPANTRDSDDDGLKQIP
jgi:hypothetical protein